MKQVKVFDEEHEDDLTESINAFLLGKPDIEIIEIRFSVAVCALAEEQVYCFSALLLYEVSG